MKKPGLEPEFAGFRLYVSIVVPSSPVALSCIEATWPYCQTKRLPFPPLLHVPGLSPSCFLDNLNTKTSTTK